MNLLLALLCAAIVASVLWIAARQRPVTNTRQPTPIDRLAQWERRMGEHRAEEIRRRHRAQIAFDSRASVQPKVNPRLPR